MADCLNNEEQVTSNLDSKNQDSLNSNLDTGNAITSDIVSDGVLVSNTNSGESVSSVLESGEALASQLDLPVTHTYRGEETDNIVVSVDNNAYTISASIKQIKFKTVADFPVVGSDRLLYIDATENSIYSWDSDLGEYRKLVADTGEVDIDLSNYYTKEETYSAEEIDDKISNVEVDLSGYYTKTETDNVATQTLSSAKSYTDTKVAELIDSAPETLDTFKEIADAFAEHEEVVDALNSAIGLKADKSELSNYVTNTELENKGYLTEIPSEYVTETELTAKDYATNTALTDGLADKVDKVEGKGLSTNDLTDDLLGKINNNTIIEITELSVHIKDLNSGVYKLAKDTKISFYSSKTITVGTEAYLFVTRTNDKRNEFYLIYSDYSGESAGATKYLVTGYCNWGTVFGYSNTFVLNKEYIDKESAQTMSGEKTFSKAPKNTDTLSSSLDDETIVTAKWTNDRLDTKQDALTAGNNISIENNIISANIDGANPIIALESPVVVYDLQQSGIYQLPADCELYINSEYKESNIKVDYDNESSAFMIVNFMKRTDGKIDKLFYLFAEKDGVGTETVGNSGSFIVGKAQQSLGNYHIVGTDIKYVTQETDGYINGNKSFVNPVKYYKQYESLDTSLNDRTLVDAQWVKSVMAENPAGTKIIWRDWS